MKVTVELTTEDIIHLIGFVAVAEMSSSPFVRNAAEGSKVFLKQCIDQVNMDEFNRAIDNCYKQIKADRPELPVIDYSKYPLFK